MTPEETVRFVAPFLSADFLILFVMPVCALCGRDVPSLTVHHLVPRSRSRKGEELPTVDICSACHRQLHVLFTNEELAREFNTLEKLRTHEGVRRFVKWVRKQAPQTFVRVRR